MSKTIGIVGAGLVGKAMARLAVAANYNVVLCNSRGPESLRNFVQELGPLARAGTIEEAIAAGEIVTLSIPLANFESLPKEKFDGKIVLDQTNYYPDLGGFRRADLDRGELTSTELIQRHLPKAHVVKGMHNLGWIHMERDARPKGDAERTTLPIAGNDAAAKQSVGRFLEDIGYDVIDSGSLAESWKIEPNTPIYFWPYAPAIPDGASDVEAKQIYQGSGKPLTLSEASTMIKRTERPSPIGGTFEYLPPVHIALFLELASKNTVG